MKILVVDDVRLQRELISQMIESLGHTVLLASDGREAVELTARERPDVILMDIEMPVMNGYQAAREITRAQGDDWVPIIFVSVSERDQDLERAIESGGSDYLVKPVSRAVLGAKIASMRRIDEMRRRQLELSQQLQVAYRELELTSQRDGLTGVANRGSFDVQMQREAGRAKRSRTALSVVLVDVDWFKRYNDQFGHPAGDACLRKVAQALQSACRRPADIVARYGGEEFVLLLPETPVEGARQVAETARAAVLACAIAHASSAGVEHVSISAGVASAAPGDDISPERLIAAADAALYRAKDLGRNRVVVADLRPFE
jgi:diguanylate cyclase (GGDEF)-like protein